MLSSDSRDIVGYLALPYKRRLDQLTIVKSYNNFHQPLCQQWSIQVSIETGWCCRCAKFRLESATNDRFYHPTLRNPVLSNSIFFPFSAQCTRTVLFHVPSSAPVPFSHISALQITVSSHYTVPKCLTGGKVNL